MTFQPTIGHWESSCTSFWLAGMDIDRELPYKDRPANSYSLLPLSLWLDYLKVLSQVLLPHFLISYTDNHREGNGIPLQYSCLENPMDRGDWWAEVYGFAKSRIWLSDFTFNFHFHALEKEMATHFGDLAWRIPGMGEPGGLPSMGSHRVGHDWSDLVAAAADDQGFLKQKLKWVRWVQQTQHQLLVSLFIYMWMWKDLVSFCEIWA